MIGEGAVRGIDDDVGRKEPDVTADEVQASMAGQKDIGGSQVAPSDGERYRSDPVELSAPCGTYVVRRLGHADRPDRVVEAMV